MPTRRDMLKAGLLAPAAVAAAKGIGLDFTKDGGEIPLPGTIMSWFPRLPVPDANVSFSTLAIGDSGGLATDAALTPVPVPFSLSLSISYDR